MMQAAMVTAMGLGMLVLRPCRNREARAPRTAVAMLLLSAAAVWVGTFGMIVSIISGSSNFAGLAAACGQVLQELWTAGLGWWQTSLVIGWFVLLPGRGIWRAGVDLHRSHLLLRRARANCRGAGPPRPTDPWIVAALGTPAITVGLLRPVVIVDANFWAATDTRREVVLAHEEAHRRGRHGFVVAIARFLIAGLRPWPAARHVEDCVRRHVEALADDAAANLHDPRVVGVVLGHVALGSTPTQGLGTAGDATWRVKRLVAPTSTSSWRDVLVLGAMTTMMAAGIVMTVHTASVAAAVFLSPNFCVI